MKFKFIAKSTIWDMQCDQEGASKSLAIHENYTREYIKSNKGFKMIWLNLTSNLRFKKGESGLKNLILGFFYQNNQLKVV